LTAFVVPRISNTASTIQPTSPSCQPGSVARVKLSVVSTSVHLTHAIANPTATTSRPPILARIESPRLRSLLTLIQSSIAPTTAAPAMASMTRTPLRVKANPPRM
jgi:hypothetical protein